MTSSQSFAQAGASLETNGFWVVPSLVDEDTRQHLLDCLGPGTAAGRRGVLAMPEISRIAHAEELTRWVKPFLPQGSVRPVRGIFFDKSPETNWLVPWHQDLTIVVRERKEVPGFGPWSVKDGQVHVQPPVECLRQMLTLRLHLDAADEANGALRVIPGSHASGRLSAAGICEWREMQPEEVCSVKAGGALLMRPLLLHASGRSHSPRHRRVLHLEYAAFDLPAGLQWHEDF